MASQRMLDGSPAEPAPRTSLPGGAAAAEIAAPPGSASRRRCRRAHRPSAVTTAAAPDGRRTRRHRCRARRRSVLRASPGIEHPAPARHQLRRRTATRTRAQPLSPCRRPLRRYRASRFSHGRKMPVSAAPITRRGSRTRSREILQAEALARGAAAARSRRPPARCSAERQALAADDARVEPGQSRHSRPPAVALRELLGCIDLADDLLAARSGHGAFEPGFGHFGCTHRAAVARDQRQRCRRPPDKRLAHWRDQPRSCARAEAMSSGCVVVDDQQHDDLGAALRPRPRREVCRRSPGCRSALGVRCSGRSRGRSAARAGGACAWSRRPVSVVAARGG